MTDENIEERLSALAQGRLAAPEYLAQRIEAQLTESAPMDRLFGWLAAAAWRGAVAAMLPLALGFSLGITSAPEDGSIWEETAVMFADSLEVYDYDEI